MYNGLVPLYRCHKQKKSKKKNSNLKNSKIHNFPTVCANVMKQSPCILPHQGLSDDKLNGWMDGWTDGWIIIIICAVATIKINFIIL